MAGPSPETQLPRHDPALTGVRALAISLVLISHMAIAQGLPWPWVLKGSGQLGVMLFFMLSGYLMASIYGHRVPDRRNLLAYTAARAGRVLPAYLAVVLASVLLGPLLPGWPYEIADMRVFVEHVLLIEGVNALWAVPVEIRFYALFAVAWLLGRSWFASCVAVLVPLTWAWAFAAGAPDQGVRPLAIYLPYFATGCALGLWLPQAPSMPLLLRWTLSFGAGFALLLAFPYARRLLGADLPIWLDPLVFAAIVLVFVLSVWRFGGFAILASGPAVWLGTRSYGIYLLNPIALFAVARWADAGPIVTPVLMLAGSVLLGALSWVLIERPAMVWARGLVAAGR